MLRFPNVATPFTAVTVLVPAKVPGSSMPPLCPMAIVTVPLKPVATLPAASVTLTCTGGGIVIIGRVVFGCTVKTKCSTGFPGLSVNAVASHEWGDWKYHVHCGSTAPALAATSYSASARIAASDPSLMLVNCGGGSLSIRPSTMLTPYTRAPAFASIGPGWATTVVESVPAAERYAPSAATDGSTP